MEHWYQTPQIDLEMVLVNVQASTASVGFLLRGPQTSANVSGNSTVLEKIGYKGTLRGDFDGQPLLDNFNVCLFPGGLTQLEVHVL